jgi:putative oxidoreductase
MPDDLNRKLAISLLLLRLSLGLVMMVWAFDKMLNPTHGAAVFESFYGLEGMGEQVVRAIGVIQALIVLAFLLGVARTYSYGAVLFMHAVTTFISWSAYLQPLKNILFFSAWPMLAALIALFLLRDHDRIASLGHRGAR